MTACLDCPHHGGDRARCCADEIEARAAEARRMWSLDPTERAAEERKRLDAEGQPPGNRAQRRRAKAKARKSRA